MIHDSLKFLLPHKDTFAKEIYCVTFVKGIHGILRKLLGKDS